MSDLNNYLELSVEICKIKQIKQLKIKLKKIIKTTQRNETNLNI